jgi:cytosine/adenosine deaminase-related metal-dependent hydrolase
MDASERSAPQDQPIQSGDESPHSESCRLTARFIFPGDGPPIENGTVEITSGVVAAISARRDSSAHDLGNVAIIPGLVNAHTHLEFSDLTSPIAPPFPFADWIRGVVAHRRSRTANLTEIVQQGLDESLRAGATCVGEIATGDASLDAIVAFRSAKGRARPHAVVFRELLGFAPQTVEPQLAVARSFLDSRPAGGRIRLGLSPHAPYSVHPELFTKLAALAAERNVPLAVHLAETREELELLDRGTGPLVEMLRAFGAWRNGVVADGTRPMDYLRLLAGAPRVAVIHGNYLADDESHFLAGHENFALVYCPRTHAYFRHERHPWRRVTEAGGTVAIGTDSRASNPDLSLWAELCCLRRLCPDVSDAELLRLGTANSAAALGMQEHSGSLKPGRSADIAVIELRGAGLFDAANRVTRVMIGGEWAASGLARTETSAKPQAAATFRPA